MNIKNECVTDNGVVLVCILQSNTSSPQYSFEHYIQKRFDVREEMREKSMKRQLIGPFHFYSYFFIILLTFTTKSRRPLSCLIQRKRRRMKTTVVTRRPLTH